TRSGPATRSMAPLRWRWPRGASRSPPCALRRPPRRSNACASAEFPGPRCGPRSRPSLPVQNRLDIELFFILKPFQTRIKENISKESGFRGIPFKRGLDRMDAIDRKILSLLQQDASLSVAEIGNRVGLSSTPCWKRIQRLEADGVIQKRVALVDQDKIGLGVTVFVSIETGDHSQEWLARFAETVGSMPEVMEFYRMAGDVDYMLRVVVTDIQGYDAFYKRLIGSVPL